MTPLPTEFLRFPLAHRGYHDQSLGVPENSRAAFEAAAHSGYGIELDVQLSADGEAMVFHDFLLDRLTYETGSVRQRRRSELEVIELRGNAETIPALDEVLALVAGRAPVLVEIKECGKAGMDDAGSLGQAVARAVNSYDGSAAVMSFSPNAVDAFASAAPEVPRGLTTCRFTPEEWPYLSAESLTYLRDVSAYDRLGVTFISHHAADLRRTRVAELRASGTQVLCWTVRSAEQEADVRRFADNITFEGYAAGIPAS